MLQPSTPYQDTQDTHHTSAAVVYSTYLFTIRHVRVSLVDQSLPLPWQPHSLTQSLTLQSSQVHASPNTPNTPTYPTLPLSLIHI